MGVLSARGSKHLDGCKELTTNSPVKVLKDLAVAGKVYFQTVSPNGAEMTCFVNVGDKVKVGTKLAQRKDFFVPIYSSVSGTVSAIETRYSAIVGRPVPHLVIDNDGKYEQNQLLKKIGKKTSKEEIVDAIKEAGIVGLGGAGFPTYVKYQTADNIHTILINGVECEPYLTTDYVEMQEEAEMMLEGASLLMKAAGASKAIIAFKKGKQAVKEKLLPLLANYDGISLKEVRDVYPMGWERTLVFEVFKKDYNKLPSEIGVIVNNAQTAIAVAKALLKGEIVADRLVTVSGDGIHSPSNVLVPIGTVAKNIVDKLGGYTCESGFILAGGPMTSKGLMNDLFPITLSMGAITVMTRKEYNVLPCLRCGECIERCPASLMPVEIKIAVEGKNVDRISKLEVDHCVECGLCSYVCPSKIDVTEFVRKAKMQLKIERAKAAAKK